MLRTWIRSLKRSCDSRVLLELTPCKLLGHRPGEHFLGGIAVLSYATTLISHSLILQIATSGYLSVLVKSLWVQALTTTTFSAVRLFARIVGTFFSIHILVDLHELSVNPEIPTLFLTAQVLVRSWSFFRDRLWVLTMVYVRLSAWFFRHFTLCLDISHNIFVHYLITILIGLHQLLNLCIDFVLLILIYVLCHIF